MIVCHVSASLAAGEVSVWNNEFNRDGKPWVPEGVTIIGLVAPIDAMAEKYREAGRTFGRGTLEKALDFGADLVRFQISQPGLDPQSEIFSTKYRQRVVDGVRQARLLGLTVIVSMQWQWPSGVKQLSGMPSSSTHRAWQSIAKVFANDRGIMLEVFNEPALNARNRSNREEWLTDMQALVDMLRSSGSKNVLLIGGLNYGRSFDGLPQIQDPLNQLGYAIHPYFGKDNRTVRAWNRNFGELSLSKPVLATEWNAIGCGHNNRGDTIRLLTYLRNHRIGLVGWAVDLPGTLFRRNGLLTDFSQETCTLKQGGGAGFLIHKYFLAYPS